MVELADIRSARERIGGKAHITPVMTSRTLDDAVGASVFLKCENFQRTGAFKFRGAYNTLSQLSGEQRSAGALTYSSGNHAQAVALVGSILGIETTIIMPHNAPRIKRVATEGYGAQVIEYDPDETTREALAADLAAKHDLTLIKPYDDPRIVAGQGTAALEFHEQVAGLDLLLTPCGGGGLLSGSAVATKGQELPCRVVGVEPELADDATKSFRTGTLHRVDNPQTIADGTRTPSLGPDVTFPLVRKLVDDMVTVSEDAIIEAVRFLFYRTKLVVEPSGALPVAALLAGAMNLEGRIGVVLSGGNIDAPTMTRILSA